MVRFGKDSEVEKRQIFRGSPVREAGTAGFLGDETALPRALSPAGPVYRALDHRSQPLRTLSFIPSLPAPMLRFQFVFPLAPTFLSHREGYLRSASASRFLTHLHRNSRTGLQNSPGLRPLQASVERCPTQGPVLPAQLHFRLHSWTPDLSLEV